MRNGTRSACGKFIKYSLFVVNLIIFIGGVIATGLGVWIVVDGTFASELLGTNLYIGSAYVIVATGMLVTFISCLGCFGSVKEIRCMLVIYFLTLFLIFVLMFIGGVLGYVFREKVEKSIRLGMDRSLSDYGNYYPVTQAWDETQTRLQCCGINSFNDWPDGRIPSSCCKIPDCQKIENKDRFSTHIQGCLTLTKEYVKEHALYIGGSGVVVSCFLILGMVFSAILFKVIE